MSRQPQSEAFDTEIVARHAVEELRGAAYSDGEWAVVRERLLAFARLAEHHYRAKRRALAAFDSNGPLNAPVWAVLGGSANAYLMRFHRFGLLDRNRDAR